MVKPDSDEEYLMEVDEVLPTKGRQRRSRSTKSKGKQSKEKTIETNSEVEEKENTPSQTTNLRVMSSAPIQLKDTFLEKKFPYLFGQDQALFDTFMDYGKNWYHVLYVFNEHDLKQAVVAQTHHLNPIEYVDLADFNIDITGRGTSEQNIGNVPVNFTVVKGNKKTEINLDPGQVVPLDKATDRKAHAINVGGYVTSSKWLPSTNESELYLAVATIKSSPDGISKVINHRDISFFNSKMGMLEVETSIQIWKYNLQANSVTLVEYIDTTAIGAASNLLWLPLSETSVLGLLAACFSDGRIHILKLLEPTSNTPVISKYETYLTYELKSSNSEKDIIPITSYSFKGTTSIIVGGFNGSIAEFILPSFTTFDDQDNDVSIPSFVLIVSDSPILGITISHPADDLFYIFAQTAEMEHAVIQYDDQKLRFSRAGSLALSESRYHHQLRVFVGLEGLDSIILLPVKCPQEKVSSILKTDSITSFAISEYIGHPFLLFGNATGELSMVNISRKLVARKKVPSKDVLFVLRLWKLSMDADNKLTLNGSFYDIPPEKADIKLSYTPPELSFSSVAWSETLAGGSVYAAASLSGFLLIERLDSSLV